jgi:beta-lactam-binding protein with PASTA domain
MKRNINLLLIMMIPLLVFSGCILTTTPKEGTINLVWGKTQAFTVSGMGTNQWYVDGSPITGETKAKYTFNSFLFSLGSHEIKVINTFALGGGEAVWTVNVSAAPVLVPLAAGCADIMNAGLVCDTTLNCSDTVLEGEVISQTPEAGASVPLGSTVHLSISSGLCTNHEIPVPEATSCTELAAVGLVCNVTHSCSDTVSIGMVISQDPIAGTMVVPGTTVTLEISTGPCTGGEVAVPNATSCDVVEAAGFICSRERECNNTVPEDDVIRQSPAPGVMAMPGTTVTLTLSTGPCPLLVPNATSCSELEAVGLVCNLVETCSNEVPEVGGFISLSPPAGTPTELGAVVTLVLSSGPCTVEVPTAAGCAEIEATGLLCSLSTQCSDIVAEGSVISQDPAPGAMVPPGSTVQLVLSSGPCTIQLPAPTNVQATDVVLISTTDPLLNDNFNNKVRITWDAVPYAQAYKIYRSDSPTGIYDLVGTVIAPTTLFNDMQSEVLTLPTWPDPLTSEALDTYEAAARAVVNNFKNFKYYKVKACSADPFHPNSELSAYDEGRMDYTLEEFYAVATGVIEGIPMARMILSASPMAIGTNMYFYDSCGSGQMHVAIAEDHPVDMSITISNFVESLVFGGGGGGGMNCSESGGRRMIINSLVSASDIDLDINGILTGSMDFTGNYAGKFTSISVPIAGGVLQPGTCTVIYNGQTSTGHTCSFFD